MSRLDRAGLSLAAAGPIALIWLHDVRDSGALAALSGSAATAAESRAVVAYLLAYLATWWLTPVLVLSHALRVLARRALALNWLRVMCLLGETLRGLAVPKRALPIALVSVPLVLLEWSVARTLGALNALSLIAGFLLLGPAAYRGLRLPSFAGVAAGYVLVFGVLIPQTLLGIQHSILTDEIGLIAVGPLFWAGSWALGRDLDWEQSLRTAEARNAELQREAERAQLLALRAHLDPHFLFNTLNAIAEWCRDDPAVAERATLQLSKMLRTILDGVRADAWPLSDELALVEQLLDLHHARDPERFTFHISVDASLRTLRLPPMILLSLVENAIKHGPAAGHCGRIEISGCLARECLMLYVRNPGAFGGPRAGGEGIATLEKRLRLAYAEGAAMRYESDDATTLAILKLPIQGEAG
jgi:hypothetical protein